VAWEKEHQIGHILSNRPAMKLAPRCSNNKAHKQWTLWLYPNMESSICVEFCAQIS
jgi:hypothetical protein